MPLENDDDLFSNSVERELKELAKKGNPSKKVCLAASPDSSNGNANQGDLRKRMNFLNMIQFMLRLHKTSLLGLQIYQKRLLIKPGVLSVGRVTW